MSTAAVGRAALILSTNAAGVRPGLDRAGADTRKWADTTARSIGDRFKGLAGSVAVGAAAAGVGAVAALKQANDTLADMARSGAAAKAFGLDAETFTGIAGVAASVGEGQREFIESMVTLGKVASEGAAGKGEVAVEWFRSLNLNAQEFKSLRLDEQFFRTFEAIRAVQDPAERVRALMVAFGEDGGKWLLPLLAKAPEDLRAMARGFAVSTESVEKATAANLAYQKATTDAHAAWREFAVMAAPAIEATAKTFSEAAAGFRDGARALAEARAAAPPAPGGGPPGEKGFGSKLWDALPSPGELGPSVMAAWEMQKDAWSDIRNKGGRAHAKLASWLTGKNIRHAEEDTGRTDRFTDALNKPPPPPPRAPGFTDDWRKWAAEVASAEAAGARLKKAVGEDLGVGLLESLPLVGAMRAQFGTMAELAGKWSSDRNAGPWSGLAGGVGKLQQLDNAALVKGSSAELSARTRHEMGGKGGPLDQVVRNGDKGNALLGDIKAAVRDLGDVLGGGAAELLPL